MSEHPKDPMVEPLEPDPTPEELAAAEALREALEGRAPDDADAEYARALRHAVAPKPMDAVAHRRILDRVVPRPSAMRVFGPFLGLAAAAAVALFVSTSREPPRPQPVAIVAKSASLQRSRPTSDLFVAPFPQTGETSKRVDAIVAARARDLRGNQFAKWGVR